MIIKISKTRIQLEAAIVITIIVALFLFDRGFSKLPLKDPLLVHDFLLVLATLISLIRKSLTFKFTAIFILCCIALIYLVWSIASFDLEKGYFLLIFRQFFLFFYLICCYIIANKVFKNPSNIDKSIMIIKKIAFWSIAFQSLYFLYLYITVPNYSPLEWFSYYSSVAVMGIISFGAYVLVYFKNYKRILLFALTLIICGLLGHASSFFALFSVFLIHFYISFSPKTRGITLGILIVIIIILFQTPQFNDSNASWRLLYWSHILDRALTENYLIFGTGFGEPYMTLDYAHKIAREINSYFMYTSVNVKYERWITPPHNSFLTMVHNIGLIPVILLFVPLKGFFSQIFFKSKTTNNNRLFLFYSLFGLIVWCSFNVILELPHSAVYFWLIYFTYIFYTRKQDEA